tara:strand:- start:729 stop:1346 length:618 start_codon:yes stop_codon:yes gene_type:complete
VKIKIVEMVFRKIWVCFFIICLSSCVVAKFKTNIVKTSDLTELSGKFLLNNFEGKSAFKINKEAHKELSAIIKDTIIKIRDIRPTILGMYGYDIPFQLNKKQLEDIYLLTNTKYLINLKGTVLKDDLSLFVGSTTYGTTGKINKVRLEISLYDLQKEALLSHKIIEGVIEVDVNTEDHWTLVQSVENMQLRSLKKIIRSYKNELK